MGSVKQPMVPGLLVYKKRQKKRLDDTVHKTTDATEEEIPSAAEEPDKAGKQQEQTDQRDVQKVDAAGDVVEETNKEADETEKNVNVNQTAEVTGVTETNSERHETVENRAAVKPSKPLHGFQRRPKRQRQNEENGAVVSPKKKVMTGNGKQAGSDGDEDEVEDDLETTRSRRVTSDDQEDHLEEDYGGTEDDVGVTKTKGKKSRKETEKANQRPAKRLKKSGAKSLSKKIVKKPGAVNTSEDLSIHGTVQERAQSTGLSEPVYQWLKELGLLKYAEHFETHEVDDGALPLLTFEDLREMGICAVGTRRKMFTSIQAMEKKMQGD